MALQRHLIIFLLVLTATPVSAEKITVAVASNFTAAMKDIVTEFEKASGHKVALSFGSSGKILAQIKHGAPFQAFFSADQTKPAVLEEDGLVVANSRFTYAIGGLVLWSTKPGIADEHTTVLKNRTFNKLAMANPKLAPYGRAAVQVLQNLNLENNTRDKWVQGENIAQTYQFVATGNTDLGFVALSQVMSKGHINGGSAWIIPRHLYQPIRQDAVLLRRGEDSQGARELLKFIRGSNAGAILESYGYQTESTLH